MSYFFENSKTGAKAAAQKAAQSASDIVKLYKPSTWKGKSWLWRIGLFIVTLCVICVALMLIFSREPDSMTAQDALKKHLPKPYLDEKGEPKKINTGAALTAMTIHLIDSLQDKPGGYLRNDVMPPGLLLDNMPAWEYGVLRNVRDISKVFRNNFSTSGTQTKMDNDLMDLENRLSIDAKKWMLPTPEKEYAAASKALSRYLERIMDDNPNDGQFYARADNLRRFFDVVSPNLGSYSQRLSESVGIVVKDTALSGERAATQSKQQVNSNLFNKTPWYRVDDNFYEARGYAWALLQEMRAISVDFAPVLADKNATAYVEQLIHELEATQKPMWSPIILNGTGFGVITNHSLVMASYLSRANAIVIELSNLLERG